MNAAAKHKIEFGDFQTPLELAEAVCRRLAGMPQFDPDVVIEPTCGLGAFVLAAAAAFPRARIRGHEINQAYLAQLDEALVGHAARDRVELARADFFALDWAERLSTVPGQVLVLGNLPWVTSAVLGALGGGNLPEKSNFQNHRGFDAISGKANFDISEWMLIALVEALGLRAGGGDVAMLVKSATARKVIAYADRNAIGAGQVSITAIDAKRHFGAAVDACLLVMRVTGSRSTHPIEYDVFESFDATIPTRVGHRNGFTVSDLAAFDAHAGMLGESPQKWRSGVKHDASSIMEFTEVDGSLVNGLGERVEIERDYLYPLMKGSSIGSDRGFLDKYVLVTQRHTGQDTTEILRAAPKTWAYLVAHGNVLDARGSTIYAKNPRFSIFGIGDYAFRPWRVAICGLYKHLGFRLIGPHRGRPVMFDDTVYYVSFETRREAEVALAAITAPGSMALYSSLIFWDEKRPVKASVLNVVDWSRALGRAA